MKRWQNYGLWVSIASLLFMLVNDLGLHITPDKWDNYVNLVLGILVMLGIVSSPKDDKWFKNKEGKRD